MCGDGVSLYRKKNLLKEVLVILLKIVNILSKCPLIMNCVCARVWMCACVCVRVPCVHVCMSALCVCVCVNSYPIYLSTTNEHNRTKACV